VKDTYVFLTAVTVIGAIMLVIGWVLTQGGPWFRSYLYGVFLVIFGICFVVPGAVGFYVFR
jgi:hypothetical protein